jgi:hypothetical protein
MSIHQIAKDGYSTVLKTTVEHSPEFWCLIDELFKLDTLIDVRDPLDVTSELAFEHASQRMQNALSDYARSVSPGSAGDLRNALYSHLGRIRYEAAAMADVESIL